MDFFCISNLLPKSSLTFEPHFTILRQDVALPPQHATITLKSTKSRQSRSKLSYVQVPRLNNSNLCPFRAVSQLLALEPFMARSGLSLRFRLTRHWLDCVLGYIFPTRLWDFMALAVQAFLFFIPIRCLYSTFSTMVHGRLRLYTTIYLTPLPQP